MYNYGVKQKFLWPVIGRTTKKGVKITVFRLGDSNFVELELIFWFAKSWCIKNRSIYEKALDVSFLMNVSKKVSELFLSVIEYSFLRRWKWGRSCRFFLFFIFCHFSPILVLDSNFRSTLNRSWFRGLHFTCWVFLVNSTCWVGSSCSIKACSDFFVLLKKVANVTLINNFLIFKATSFKHDRN